MLGDPLGLGMAYLCTNETIIKEGLLTLQYAYFLFLAGEYDKIARAFASALPINHAGNAELC